ncbi:MFS transporter [Mesorhizobium sp. CO1-1-8]|uniref:MFS transporter n=1 Tax=Mesorhizobium sp. CO1-1-8 TaxID=2876631 RepID=UPI001CD07A5E|nr:MFS transporter [Mesorhizobium sp. CO1-1-8]MBZ9772190.1 MHS family MFS transporter [Mesorhizobium sp. CO1-1-8]
MTAEPYSAMSDISSRKKSRSVIAATTIGTYVEWYDFYLYGASSALVFNKLFFPQFDSFVGTILSLLTFASGFLARPIGGYVCGYFGDRFGRKNTLMATMVVMGMATFLMGLVPTYAMIGAWGAIILVVLRLIQGFASGGEWSGALVMVAEAVPDSRRGMFGGLLSATTQAAFVSGAAILAFMNYLLDDADFLSWGWRVPFLLSFLTIIIGVYIRMRVPESEEFEAVKKSGDISANPLAEVVSSPRNILAVMAIRISENTYYYVVSIFALTYGVTHGIERSVVLNAVTLGALLAVVFGFLVGALTDIVGGRPMMIIGQFFQLAWIFPYYLMFNTGNPTYITIATVIAIVTLVGMIDAPQAKFVPPLFPARLRYSGVAAGRETAAIIGGLTPAIATALVAANGGSPWMLCTVLVFCTLLGLGGVLLAKPMSVATARS